MVKLVGSCVFYLVHPDTKCLQKVTFYVANNNGSVLLSCATILTLAWHSLTLDWNIFLIELALLPVVLTTQTRPNPKSVYMYQEKNLKSLQCPTQRYGTQAYYKKGREFLLIIQMCLIVLDTFLVPQYHIQIDPSVTPSQTPCWPVPVHLKDSFKKKIDKMLWAGVLKPVHQATPWINSFVLVEGKDKLGNPKLRICLDQPIWIKQLCMSHITLKHHKILPNCLQKPAQLQSVIVEKVIGTSSLMKLPLSWQHSTLS